MHAARAVRAWVGPVSILMADSRFSGTACDRVCTAALSSHGFPACVDTRGRRARGDAWPTSNHSLDAPAARFRFSYVAAQCVLCAQAPITHSRVTACALADTYRGFAAKHMKKRKWLFAGFSKNHGAPGAGRAAGQEQSICRCSLLRQSICRWAGLGGLFPGLCG